METITAVTLDQSYAVMLAVGVASTLIPITLIPMKIHNRRNEK